MLQAAAARDELQWQQQQQAPAERDELQWQQSSAAARAASDGEPPTPHEEEAEEQVLGYCDEKVANREIRVWHGATENGP
jgi:hypothetical protein